MDRPTENLVNAGIIFMFSVWIQGQMSDLIIFKKDPSLVPDFVANPKRVPKEFFVERVRYWEKQFGSVKNEFAEVFKEHLTESEKVDLEEIYHVRNMVAHAHVSIVRDYMIFRPHGGAKREGKLIEDLKIRMTPDASNPMMLKLEFWRSEVFARYSDLMERFDQVCLSRLANLLEVPHGRIR